jgi:type IV pilus assembly protein PilF
MQSTRVCYLSIFFILFSIITSCTSSPSLDKERAALKMQLGVSHLENNNLPLALKELLEAEALDSKNALIQSNLGLVYFLRKKMDLSISHYSNAIKLNPQLTETKNSLARVYIEIKQYSKAETLLNSVIEDLTYTNMNSAYMNYGLMRFNQKRFADAKVLFRKVLETDRENCYAQIYLGRSYLDLVENQDAATQLEKAVPICLQLRVEDAHYFSGIAYFRLGQKNKSLQRFQEVIKLFPDSTNAASSKKMIEIIQRNDR